MKGGELMNLKDLMMREEVEEEELCSFSQTTPMNTNVCKYTIPTLPTPSIYKQKDCTNI